MDSKRTKHEIIKDLINELQYAPDSQLCIKNHTGEDIVLRITKASEGRITVEVCNKDTRKPNVIVLGHQDSVKVDFNL